MNSHVILRSLRASQLASRPQSTTLRTVLRRQFTSTCRRSEKQAADDPNFVSVLDGPPQLVRQKRRHGPGLIILGK